VQQLQYRVPASFTKFLLVVGSIEVLVGAIVIPAAASQLQRGGISGVVVGAVLMVAGGFPIALAVRPDTLIVDDGGLRLRTIVSVRVIPWSLVRSFQARPGSRGMWFVRAELSTGKKVLLPGPQGRRSRAERIAAELTAAHREHLAAGGD